MQQVDQNAYRNRGLTAVARIVALACLVAGLVACTLTRPTTTAAPESAAETAATDSRPVWWYVRLRFARGAGGETDSYLDTLVADRIFAPAIERHRAEIPLWRFHRRWPDDPTGHQFSFLFFAPPDQARPLLDEVAQHPVLDRLRGEGHLAEFRIDPAPPARAGDPGATSDPSWPPEIQREWPHFIMGASRMWLGLLRAEAGKRADMDLHARYRAVSDALDRLWYEEGSHAFLHHLNALFGYAPVQVIHRDIMTF